VDSVIVTESCLVTLGTDALVRCWTNYQHAPTIQTAQLQARHTSREIRQSNNDSVSE